MLKINRRHRVSILVGFVLLTFIFLFIAKYFLIPGKPNILLVTFDALRYDHLGCYGYGRNTSPNIDLVAKNGVTFLNAISQSSYTAPSMASILTSTYPIKHGVYGFGDKIKNPNDTLSYLLKKQGYRTAFFSSHVGIATINGFDSDFDTFYTTWTFKEDEKNRSFKAIEINSRIIKWLKENSGRKFFAWIHYLEPHYPMSPPLSYQGTFSNDSAGRLPVEVPISTDSVFGFKGLPKRLVVANNYITDLNYYIDLYDSTVRYADDCLGEIIGVLKAMGLDKKTLIIITADHGESLGEHNQYFSHGCNLYDELIKVPLILSFPKTLPLGKIVSWQAQLVDIVPTVLEVLRTKKTGLDGNSLISLSKEFKAPTLERYAFSVYNAKVAIRSNDMKLIYTIGSDQYELYNLSIDPLELDNLGTIKIKQFEQLENKLKAYFNYLGREYKEKNKVFISKEAEDKLKSLGYAN